MFVVCVALRFFYVCIYLFYFRFEVGHTMNILFFVFPLSFHCAKLLSEVGEFLSYFCKSCSAKLIRFFFESGFFDFELHDFTRNFIHFGGHRVYFGTNHCARFVYKVNCFVRQKSVGNVSVGKSCGSNQCTVVDSNAVINLVTFF